jgi:hypothetical protein
MGYMMEQNHGLVIGKLETTKNIDNKFKKIV